VLDGRTGRRPSIPLSIIFFFENGTYVVQLARFRLKEGGRKHGRCARGSRCNPEESHRLRFSPFGILEAKNVVTRKKEGELRRGFIYTTLIPSQHRLLASSEERPRKRRILFLVLSYRSHETTP
jgi:hypothetical protein